MRLYFTKAFLRKSKCIEEAKRVVRLHGVKMDIKECAEEIYFHAWAYYHIPFRWIKERAMPVDLEDGGDRWYRKIVYRLVWRFT